MTSRENLGETRKSLRQHRTDSAHLQHKTDNAHLLHGTANAHLQHGTANAHLLHRTANAHWVCKTGAALALLMLLFPFIPCTTADREQDLEYITYPDNIPNFANYSTPAMKQGDRGVLEFTIHNRYDRNITNVRLVTDIHEWATIEGSKDIAEIDHRPEFVPAPEHEVAGSGNVVYRNWSILEINSSREVRFTIAADGDTPQGTYFVRVELQFDYNGTGENSSYRMRSRGHFSSELWDEATSGNEGDPPGAHSGTGNVNLTLLGVDGILPDTSFSVDKSFFGSDPDNPLGMDVMPVVGFPALVAVAYLRRKKCKQ